MTQQSGKISVTGVKPGRTDITIRAGDVTGILPVTVSANWWPEYSGETDFGLTYDPMGDGMVHVHGTSTKASNHELYATLPAGTYRASITPTDISDYTQYFEIQDAGNRKIWRSFEKPLEFTVDTEAEYKFMFRHQAGLAVDITCTPTLERVTT